MSDMKHGVPVHIHPFLNKLGWAWDEFRKMWWKTLDDGSPYSPHAADHERAFPDALASAALRANASTEGAAHFTDGAATAATAPLADQTASSQSAVHNPDHGNYDKPAADRAFDQPNQGHEAERAEDLGVRGAEGPATVTEYKTD